MPAVQSLPHTSRVMHMLIRITPITKEISQQSFFQEMGETVKRPCWHNANALVVSDCAIAQTLVPRRRNIYFRIGLVIEAYAPKALKVAVNVSGGE